MDSTFLQRQAMLAAYSNFLEYYQLHQGTIKNDREYYKVYFTTENPNIKIGFWRQRGLDYGVKPEDLELFYKNYENYGLYIPVSFNGRLL